MIDTSEAPEWSDSDVCERCRTLFTLTNRKHHCRNCGKTYCNQCSRNNIQLPRLGINKEVRVCDGCYSSVTGKTAAAPDSPVTSYAPERLSSNNSSSKEEEELQRAIAISLLEANKSTSKSVPSPKPKVNEEEDPELAAAIAASLAEVNVKESPPARSHYPDPAAERSRSPSPVKASKAPPKAAVAEPSGTSATEMQNVALFHQLMDRMDADPSGASSHGILQDRELKNLHASMTTLHPKVVKEIEECVEKHK
eukprot:Partr_v1_DN29026_c1_g3_i3_m58722 putative Zinc finger, FYVE domain containing